MVVPHVASPTGLPSEYLETHHYTDVTMIPIDPGGFERHHGCDGAGAAAGRHGAVGARPGSRYRGKDRIGAGRVLAVRAKHQNNEVAQSERMVRGIHAPAQSGHRGRRPVRRRRARQAGGAAGDAGHQGIRRQATPAADQGGKCPEKWMSGRCGTAAPRETMNSTAAISIWMYRRIVRRWRWQRRGYSSGFASAVLQDAALRRDQSRNQTSNGQRPTTKDRRRV